MARSKRTAGAQGGSKGRASRVRASSPALRSFVHRLGFQHTMDLPVNGAASSADPSPPSNHSPSPDKDNNGEAPASAPRIVKKRNRAQLSCTACHSSESLDHCSRFLWRLSGGRWSRGSDCPVGKGQEGRAAERKSYKRAGDFSKLSSDHRSSELTSFRFQGSRLAIGKSLATAASRGESPKAAISKETKQVQPYIQALLLPRRPFPAKGALPSRRPESALTLAPLTGLRTATKLSSTASPFSRLLSVRQTSATSR
jgi:hypothetical protein